jgi:hypothetical protein
MKSKGHQAADSRPMEGLARFGLATRGAVYVLIGFLALLMAFGWAHHQADQRGAFQAVASREGGYVLLTVVVIGLAAYALWRFTEAAFGVAGAGRGVGPRIMSLLPGVAYAFLAYTAVDVLTHSGQANDQQLITARVMTHPAGRWMVGAIGVGIAVSGVVLIFDGVSHKFERYMLMGQMNLATQKTVRWLGIIGATARGLVFGIIGVLVVDAAVTYRPSKARGIDGALRSLQGVPAGRVLIAVIAVGLILFGLYGFAEARWHKT